MRRSLSLFTVLVAAALLVAPALAQRIPADDPPCGAFDNIDRETFPGSGYDPDPQCTGLFCAGEDLVIDNQALWESFWSKHISNVFIFDPDLGWIPSNEPPPAVDFDEKLVVATFQGRRRTTGYSTTVTCVQYIESDLLSGAIESVRVTVRDISPGPNCIVNQALTNPYHFVIVDRPDTLGLGTPQVSFVHTAQVTVCPGDDDPDDDLCRVCLPGDTGGIGDLPCCE